MNKYRRPHRYKKKKSIFRSKAFWFSFFIILISSAIFYFIFLSPFFQIKEIRISGNEKVSEGALKEIINEKIEKKIWFFSSKSIFLADIGQISRDLSRTFPLIGEIKVKREFSNALTVNINERKPVALLIQGEKVFYLDKEGIIFEPVSLEEGLVKILDKQKINNLGEEAISKEKLSQILDIDSKLRLDLKVPVQQFEMEADDKLNLVMDEGWQAFFDLQKDVNWQIIKLGAVLEEKIPPEKRKDLEYIELRFGNFAPYKYKNQSIL